MKKRGEKSGILICEKKSSGMIQSSEQAIHEIETVLAREEIQRNIKQAREDIESGNLFDADMSFEELRKTSI